MLVAMACARFDLEAAYEEHRHEDPLVLIGYVTGAYDFQGLFRSSVIITQGDDLVVSLDKGFDGLTTRDLAKTLKYFGISMTNSDKTDPFTNPIGSRPVTELSFLKRGFAVIGDMIVSPLELKSIYKSIYFTKKGVKKDDFLKTVEVALLELSMHGEKVFNEHAPKIESVVWEHHEAGLANTRWRDALMKVRSLEQDYR